MELPVLTRLIVTSVFAGIVSSVGSNRMSCIWTSTDVLLPTGTSPVGVTLAVGGPLVAGVSDPVPPPAVAPTIPSSAATRVSKAATRVDRSPSSVTGVGVAWLAPLKRTPPTAAIAPTIRRAVRKYRRRIGPAPCYCTRSNLRRLRHIVAKYDARHVEVSRNVIS